MKKITLLGCGLVGRAMALDLCQYYRVKVLDVNPNHLDGLPEQENLEKETLDLSNLEAVRKGVSGADLVVGALPGFMGYQTLKAVIEEGKDMVDISFLPEEALSLDSLAKEKGVVAVVDAGVAPGMSNFILGHHWEKDEIHTFQCYVGGLPIERKWPYQYKAPFSPTDVLEEYTRPARIMVAGEVVTRPALSDLEHLEFSGIGTLEAFLSDGLRSLLRTVKVPHMEEKTLRYPGHCQTIQILKETGLLDSEPVEVGGAQISPRDLTSKLLFQEWKLEEGDPEFTVMKIRMLGREKEMEYDLLDYWNPDTGISSMARTTGYACTAMVRLVLEGKYTDKGISPPELIGKDGDCFDFVMEHLKERGVVYECSV